MNLKDPTGRLAHWIVELMPYKMQIVKRKDISVRVPSALANTADSLSLFAAESPEKITPATFVDPTDQWFNRRRMEVEKFPDLNPDWMIEDELLFHHRPNPNIEEILPDLNAWKLVVPRKFRQKILHQCHDPPQMGHLGVEKTFQRILQVYYWPNLFRDVCEFVKHCQTCQMSKVEQRGPASLMRYRSFNRPWLTIAADMVGPLPKSKSGFEYLLVIQDLFTKWIELCPLRKATGAKIVESFEELVVTRVGSPKQLLTDNGTEFVNSNVDKFVKKHNISHITTPVYNPRANPVERVNRVIKTMIIAFVKKDHRDWDHHIYDFRFAYNTAFHSSLQATPAFLNYGRELLPEESLRAELEPIEALSEEAVKEWRERMTKLNSLRNLIVNNLHDAHERQANRYNLRRRPRRFFLNDLVSYRNRVQSSKKKEIAAKLAPKFVGPFKISKVLSRNVYEITEVDSKRKIKVSVDDLKPYTSS